MAVPAAAALNYVTPSVSTTARQSRGMYVKKRVSRTRKQPYSLKTAIRAITSAHHLPVGDGPGVNAVALVHNNIYAQNLLNLVTQGTNQQARTGDTVYVEAVKVKAWVETPIAAINGLSYRVMVLWHDDFYANSILTSGTIALGDLNMISTGVGRTNLMIVDPKKTTVLYDETYTINPSISGAIDVVPIQFSCSIKKQFNFIPGTQEGKDRNLYLVLIPAIAAGAAGATACGTIYANNDLIFKVSK